MKKFLVFAAVCLCVYFVAVASWNRHASAALTFDTGQASVASTATLIVGANAQRTGLLIINTGTTAFYVGNSAVLTTTGAYVAGSAGASISLPTKDAVYGISTGTSAVTYVETYQSF